MMPPTTTVANIAHLLDLNGYAGHDADRYDLTAIHTDYLAEIEAHVNKPDEKWAITIDWNGDVHATLDIAEDASRIDWQRVTDSVDVTALFKRHDKNRESA